MSGDKIQDLRQFVVEHPFPTDILVETIATCNLRCIMCPQERLTRPKGRMSMELWRKIVDEVARVSPDTRLWPAVMGEPLLLGREIFEMIAYATGKGLQVHLNTNLNAYRADMADDLFASGLQHLLIGVDGAGKEVYESIRRNGDFDRLVENIHHVLDERERRGLDHPVITLQFITMGENIHEREAFVQYWKDAGKRLQLKIKPRTGWAEAVDPWFEDESPGERPRDIPCTWLLRQMTIFWDGRVPQCDGDWNGITNMGDVNDNTIAEIWMGPLKALREKHFRLEFDAEPCKSCQDWQAGRAQWVQCGDE